MFNRQPRTAAQTAAIETARADMHAAIDEFNAVGASNKELRAEFKRRMAAATTRDEKNATRVWMRDANNALNC